MKIIRKLLFEGATLQIGLFEAHPVSDACGEVERQSQNAVVLPFNGVFSKHDSPSRHVTGTPSHAVFIAADTPYRLSFPGAIGDRAIILRFGEDVAPDCFETRNRSEFLSSHGLLPASAMMLRNLLRRRLEQGEVDRFEVEARGLDLLGQSLASIQTGDTSFRRAALARRSRAVERVREAVALAPADSWNVAKLANIANLSPFHLCRVFREMTGASIHNFVLRERLALALNAVLDSRDDLTGIALDAGFASHSHFTAHFRRFYGCTPATLRRMATTRLSEFRKIATAGRHPAA